MCKKQQSNSSINIFFNKFETKIRLKIDLISEIDSHYQSIIEIKELKEIIFELDFLNSTNKQAFKKIANTKLPNLNPLHTNLTLDKFSSMGNLQDKSTKKHKNALEVIKKMKVKDYKLFEDLFRRCDTDQIQQVGKPLHLKEKIKEYVNSNIISTLQEFEKKYSLYREVRGDGNCFYRSVFFLYIENLICLSETNPDEVERRIEQLREASVELHKAVMPQTIPQELEKFLVHITKFFNCGIYTIYLDIIQDKKKTKVQKIADLQAFMNKYPIFDFSSILLLRKLAMRGYEKFSMQMQYFYIGNEHTIIQDYSMEGQNCIVKLICEYLQIPIQIEYVQRDSVNTVLFTPEFTQIDLSNAFPTIYLFFRPGHYDICYPKDYANEIYFNQSANNRQIPKKIVTQGKQKPQLMKQISTNYCLKDSCFFCNESIHMLINEMRICQNCYNQKIGQSTSHNECKICKQSLVDNMRSYCLCDGCEQKYLDFTDSIHLNSNQISQIPSKSFVSSQKNTPIKEYQQQQQLNQSQLRNNDNFIIIDEEQKQQSFLVQNEGDLCVVNQIKQASPPSQRQSTLISDNLIGICNFLQEEQNLKYITQSNVNSVRCVLCLNITNEFQQIKCKKHLVCIQCSQNCLNLQTLCYCNSQTNINQQILKSV